MPISWQGWIIYGLIFALCAFIGWRFGLNSPEAKIGITACLLISLPLIAARTRGGWKWRWGSADEDCP